MSAASPFSETTELRQLTIVFCDLVDSTGIGQRLDLENYYALLDQFHSHCAEVVQRYEGHVAESEGDGAAYYFGWPAAHGDDPKRALHAALEIINTLPDVSGRCEERWGEAIQVHIGIDTGRVLVGEMGAGGRRERRAVGPTTNVASLLQGIAPPGALCISGETYEHVEGYFTTEPYGQHEFKGLNYKVQAYRVHGTSGAETRLEVALRKGLTPFVGREDSLDQLRATWSEVEDGRGRVVLIGGDAGIGKSRYVHEFRQLLAGDAAPIDCFCSPYHRNTELYPVKSLIQRRLGFEQGMSPADKLARLKDRLEHLPEMPADAVAFLAAFLSIPDPGNELPPMSPQRRLQRTLEVVLDWLRAVVSRQPTFLVFEDLHWADPATIEFLGMVIRMLDPAHTNGDGQPLRLCAALTFRPEEFRPPWDADAHGHLVRVDLGSLESDAASRLIRHAADGRGLPEEVTQRILERTGGLPLFVEEVTRAVIESGIFEDHGDHYTLKGPMPDDLIPDSLEGTLMARLDSLGASKQVAQFAAVLGRDFRYDMLHAAVPEFEGVAFDEALETLVSEKLLLSEGEPPSALYVFKHEMIRDVAYQSLIPSTRRKFHGLFAEKILDQFAEVAEDQPALLAYHLESAGRPDDAFDYWCKAGRRALHAADQYAHFAKALGTLPGHVGPETQLELQKAAMFALMTWKGWAAPEVEAACNQAMEVLDQQEAQVPESAAELRKLLAMSRFGTVWGLWTINFLRSNLGPAKAMADAVLQAASQGSPEDPATAMALELAHHAVGYTAYFLGDLEAAAEHAAHGLAMYAQGEPYDLERVIIKEFQFASANALRHIEVGTLWQTGSIDAAREKHDEGERIARALDHPPSLAFWLTVTASHRCCQHDPEQVLAVTEELIPLAQAERLELWGGPARIYRGWAIGVRGDPAAGLAEMQRGIEMVLGTHSKLMVVQAYGLMAELLMLAGMLEQAYGTLEEAKGLALEGGDRHMLSEIHRLQAAVLQQQGRPAEEAHAALKAAVDEAAGQGARTLALRALVDLGELLRQQGGAHDAAEAVRTARGHIHGGASSYDVQRADAFLQAVAQEAEA